MVGFSPDLIKRLAATRPRSNDDTIPARYFELNPARRVLVREAHAEAQGGLCWYCKSRLDTPPPPHIVCLPVNWRKFPGGEGFLNHPVHLHHSHLTGMTLGAVHAYCNAILFDYHGE